MTIYIGFVEIFSEPITELELFIGGYKYPFAENNLKRNSVSAKIGRFRQLVSNTFINKLLYFCLIHISFVKMRKNIRALNASRVLLFTYAAFFILLVISRNHEFWNQRKASSLLVEMVPKASERQTVFTDLYNRQLQQEIALLRLSYSGVDQNNLVNLKEIISRLKSDHSLLIGSEKYISGNDEHELFKRLEKVFAIKNHYLEKFIKQINDRNYDRIRTDYEDSLHPKYSELLILNSKLLTSIKSHDQKLMNNIGEEIIRINTINTWISVGLIILVISMGLNLISIAKKEHRITIALKESERKYRTITEQTNEIIEKCDAAGRFVFANDSFKKRFEYSDDELFDLKLSDLLAEGCLPENEGLTKTKVVTNFESVFNSKSGKRIYLEGSVLLEYKNGFFQGSMGFFNDVTEKKKLQESLIASELKFRNFFNLAPIPMWVIDPETFRFVLVNNAAVMHYGYTEMEFLSMTYMDIRGKQDLPTKEFLRKKGDCIGSGNNENYMSSFTHVKKCGEKINVEIYTSPIDINERQGILCVAIDVTERNEFENKITKAIIKTQEDERYEIGSELHDNVCQILAAAKMSLGMIKPSLVPQAVQSYNKSYEAINLATNEIRNLSHRLAPAFFDDTKLEEAFKSLLKSFNITEAYKVSVYFDKSSKQRLISQDIKLNLYRILQEQMRNIVEHAHCSIIEVSVFIFDHHLHMRIADNGVGFNKNLVQYGIGMANMTRRAELFAGKLYVQSKKGEGCEVLVKIPVEKLN